MVKMKNENNLQVTFSKRRSGLFKKASELCTLCGAEVVVIVFSPGRKVFSFGHPNVDLVIDRFLNIKSHHPNQHNNLQVNDARQNALVQDLNNHLTQVIDQLEAEKKRNEGLKQKRRDSKRAENWWEEPIEEFDLTQLTEFKCGLENLRKTVTTEASKYLQANQIPRHNYYVESSSSAAFGVSGNNGNINTDLDLFNHPGMVNMNAFNYNHNMMVAPNHTTPAGNNGNITQGFAPEYNQNQNQYQFKQEDISENDHHPNYLSRFGDDYY
ncbi:unnamed protein product [Microthlaspi erraticum]|uniref:MADS-box domain-containing protein n=1 Tax=Microthlaspi erraticum TaxID=1685480 RepID=A0A6D2J0Q6_9BRAS|nr:unnamed protein product [Microthlaspi erraticum]